eukprot:CAMPEP_0196745104 /NCGR_PEP_ID=MMETSP1091-20130531/60147_1 /TAXON_ID=302021 /ORGANISM="Rhodomonas sp., Strain CCMP768" /LENGTH=109 /DNA_ID=CAMNT_0042091787 /DNA_START=182 /DNA_END=509 /DNA_ORIENTATION=+
MLRGCRCVSRHLDGEDAFHEAPQRIGDAVSADVEPPPVRQLKLDRRVGHLNVCKAQIPAKQKPLGVIGARRHQALLELAMVANSSVVTCVLRLRGRSVDLVHFGREVAG